MFDKRADTQWIPVSQGTTRNHKVHRLPRTSQKRSNQYRDIGYNDGICETIRTLNLNAEDVWQTYINKVNVGITPKYISHQEQP